MESITHFLKNHGIAKLTKVLNQELYLKLRVSIFVSSGKDSEFLHERINMKALWPGNSKEFKHCLSKSRQPALHLEFNSQAS